MKELNDIPKKLKALRVKYDLTQKALAQKLNVGITTLAETEQGVRPLNNKITLALLQVFNYDIIKDVYINNNQISNLSINKNLIKIPFYRISAAAGQGLYLDDNILKEELFFDKNWLSLILPKNINFKYINCITAVGDSMTTSDNKGILNGDLLFVDTSQTFINNGIFVIVINNELRVKRLIKLLDGTLSIQSDNPHYPTEMYYPDKSPYELNIMGKVVFNTSRGNI